MPLKTIGDRILADAKAEADRLESRANKSAAQIINEAKENGKLFVADAVDRERQRGLQEKLQKLAAAGLAARDGVISAKQEIIDEAFNRARALIEGLDEARYIEVLAGIIAANAGGGEEIVFDPRDGDLAKQIIDQANAALGVKGIKPVSPAPRPRSIGKGFVFRQGKVEENFAFDLLFKSAREDLEAEIAAIIFGEPG